MRKYVHLVPASKPGVLRVFRDEIAALLVSEAKHLHPERITFTFGIAATDIDLDQQLVDLSSQDKLSKQVGGTFFLSHLPNCDLNDGEHANDLTYWLPGALRPAGRC